MNRRTRTAGTRQPCAAAVLALALLLTGCGSAGETEPPAREGPTPAEDPAPVSKLLVIVVENHSLDQMRDGMPYTYSLARRYAYATDYHAVTHPSLPNYLALAGGSTHGVERNGSPAAYGVSGPSVFGQALAAGRTATVYAEGMRGPCRLTDNPGTRYAVRHNPWTYHLDERELCERYDVPLTRLAADVDRGRLPNVGLVVPDTCHDAHDCDLATADSWIRAQMIRLMSGSDWRSGRLAVVITADEDDRHQDNLVLTTVMHPSLHGVVHREDLGHYSLSRSLSEVAGAEPLGEAADATSLLDAFGLRAAR